jgi:hypothetical protein
MDSGLLKSVLFSWEVIAVCIALMLLLPLVFYVASTRSRRKLAPPPFAKPLKAKPAVKPPAEGPPAEEAAGGTRPEERSRSRPFEPPEDDELTK